MSAWATGSILEKLKKNKLAVPEKNSSERQPSGAKQLSSTNASGTVSKSDNKAIGGDAAKVSNPKSKPNAAAKEGDVQKAVAPQTCEEKVQEPKEAPPSSRHCPVILPPDMEELVTDEFVFTGIVQVPVKEAKKNDLGTTTSTPEPAPQTTVSAVPSATCSVAPRPNGSVTSAYPMHHHHHHYHQPSHQKQQQQQQQQPPLQSPPVQHQEQHSWSAGYHEHHYRQYRGVHHHHHHQQAQQPYNRAGATGKVYQDAYNPVDYDMNVCAPPYYPRMYNRYPGMHMGPGAYLNMGDFTGFSLQHQSPYFPPQQVQPNSFTPPPPASQQAWMRGDGTLPNARRVDGNPPWYPGAHPGFNDAMSAWKQMRNNVWSKPPEQGGAPTAP